ncbi:hypothetical protein [Pontibacter vulgaris]|nr:hypothetical protein [Pontibacter vulgaris]
MCNLPAGRSYTDQDFLTKYKYAEGSLKESIRQMLKYKEEGSS